MTHTAAVTPTRESYSRTIKATLETREIFLTIVSRSQDPIVELFTEASPPNHPHKFFSLLCHLYYLTICNIAAVDSYLT